MNTYLVIGVIVAMVCIIVDVCNMYLLLVRTSMPRERKYAFLMLEVLHLLIFGALFLACPYFMAILQKSLNMTAVVEGCVYVIVMVSIGWGTVKAGNTLELAISRVNSKYI